MNEELYYIDYNCTPTTETFTSHNYFFYITNKSIIFEKY